MTTSPENPAYDIWVDFNDIYDDGLVGTYTDFTEATAEITVGEKVTAGDSEGNTCPATVVTVEGTHAVLQLDLDRFQAAQEST
jgi:hypothetical protein